MERPRATATLLLGMLCAAGASLMGACTPAAVAGVGLGAEAVSLTSTKKTLGDHLASAATGKDCSSVTFTQTGTYCPDKLVVDRSNVYCYRTLADVDCHYLPDPYKNGYTALASPPPDIRTIPKEKGWFDEILYGKD